MMVKRIFSFLNSLHTLEAEYLYQIKKMNLSVFIFFVLLISNSSLFAQNSFELLIQTEQDEEIYSIIENNNNDFVAVGTRYYNSYTEKVGLIVIMNNLGEILEEKEIQIEDSLIGLVYIYQKSNDNYLCFGSIKDIDETSKNLYVCEFDPYLNFIKSEQYSVGENITPNIEGILENAANNLVLYGAIFENLPYMDMLFFELSQDLDSINMYIDNSATTVLSFALSLIEKKDNSGYYALSHGYNQIDLSVLNIDNEFNIISTKVVPDETNYYGSLKWFSDSTYIITSRKTHPNKYQDDDISCMILDTAENTILHQNYFGAVDTADIPGRLKSLDYIDKNNIYIAGTHIFYYENPNPPSAPEYDNYIFINKTDSLLNIKHEIFYGGDMGYYVWSVNATSDGGCIIAASRYDHETQEDERDALILKLDSELNLPVSIEEPKIKTNELIIYPNPGNDLLKIRTAIQSIGGEFYLFDIYGKLIFQKTISDRFTLINTNTLLTGTYIYSYIYKNKEVGSGKWIKNAL
jgi:hypothetical protein